jgi:hypothetical protein
MIVWFCAQAIHRRAHGSVGFLVFTVCSEASCLDATDSVQSTNVGRWGARTSWWRAAPRPQLILICDLFEKITMHEFKTRLTSSRLG